MIIKVTYAHQLYLSYLLINVVTIIAFFFEGIALSLHIIIYIIQYKKQFNKPDARTAGPLKTRCWTAQSTSCFQWTGVTSSHEYSWVVGETRYFP